MRIGSEGLAFASAQAVHVGLVLWLFYLAPGSNGGMAFFWVGILCTYLLALFSLPRLHDALGPPLWRILRTVAIEYIALAFAADFILGPLQANGLDRYPLSYLRRLRSCSLAEWACVSPHSRGASCDQARPIPQWTAFCNGLTSHVS